MRFRRSAGVLVLLAAGIGLPMCGSSDSKVAKPEGGGEAGVEAGAGAPGSGGSDAPGSPGGEGGAGPGLAGMSGAVGGAAAGETGQSGAGGDRAQGGESPRGGESGAAGAPGFCAVAASSCCGDEPSCDTWPGMCGQDMNSYSCCEAGERQSCSVEYFDGNYHVVYAREQCSCSNGECSCACVKGDPCGSGEVDCTSTSWSDACGLGNSPTCCDSANGIRQKCEFNGFKTFSGSVVIDACTGEGFGTQPCSTCLDVDDPPCDQAFAGACNADASYCSNAEIGYRLGCQDGVTNVTCTCDPQL